MYNIIPTLREWGIVFVVYEQMRFIDRGVTSNLTQALYIIIYTYISDIIISMHVCVGIMWFHFQWIELNWTHLYYLLVYRIHVHAYIPPTYSVYKHTLYYVNVLYARTHVVYVGVTTCEVLHMQRSLLVWYVCVFVNMTQWPESLLGFIWLVLDVSADVHII